MLPLDGAVVDEQRDAEPDEEQRRARSVDAGADGPAHAARRPAATSTRHGLRLRIVVDVPAEDRRPAPATPRRSRATISSALRLDRLLDDRRDRPARADDSGDRSHAVALDERAGLVEEVVGLGLLAGQVGVERLLERHLDDVDDRDRRAALCREPRRSDQGLLRLGRAQHGDDDRPVGDLEAGAEDDRGRADRLAQRQLQEAPTVDRVDDEPDREPGEAGPPRLGRPG